MRLSPSAGQGIQRQNPSLAGIAKSIYRFPVPMDPKMRTTACLPYPAVGYGIMLTGRSFKPKKKPMDSSTGIVHHSSEGLRHVSEYRDVFKIIANSIIL